MRTIQLGSSNLNVPTIAVGCMSIAALDDTSAHALIQTAMERGANFFDHADIYGGGESEVRFAKAAAGIPREKMILQSKCAIVPGKMYDFSKAHILSSVEGILKRLKTDYLDTLLLHRPDMLMEPEEVAEAFAALKSSGKVRLFGVSNQNPMQIQLLQSVLPDPLVANQLQLSITNATMISQGINVNMLSTDAVQRDGSVLDYCRLHKITIQPWSPLRYGFFEGFFIGSPKHAELNKLLDEIAGRYGVTPTTIAFAWLLRHPAKFQPITGTTKSARLAECLDAESVQLSREEWYQIYLGAGNDLP